MTSDDTVSLILRRLDEIERKLDDMRDGLRGLETRTAIGYSVRRGRRQGKIEAARCSATARSATVLSDGCRIAGAVHCA